MIRYDDLHDYFAREYNKARLLVCDIEQYNCNHELIKPLQNGFIYGCGLMAQKTEFKNNKLYVSDDIRDYYDMKYGNVIKNIDIKALDKMAEKYVLEYVRDTNHIFTELEEFFLKVKELTYKLSILY